ncbi:tetratricopeptide repeat protein [Gammaproteobacteria bacterium]|nr:tetratricopeptide repeat protein [Gammaproteobacteria bacterium]
MNAKSSSQVKTLLLQALAAVNSSKWNIAESICKNILSLHPDQLDTTYMLGHIYQNTGENDLAITQYEKVLLLSNCHADALTNLGTIHESSGNIGEALNFYKKAVRCNPSHFQGNYNLGRTSRSRGDLKTAITSLRTALVAENESVPVLLELGLALKNAGLTSEALTYLHKAREINPDNPIIYNILGNIYQLKGELKQAISSYLSAIQRNPCLAEPYNNLGSTYVAMGDVPTALENYRKALDIRLDFNGAASNILLAENYVSNNQEDLFHKHVAWGNSLNPPSPIDQHRDDIRGHKKIRVGYISPDFRAHSVAWFMMAILQNYNHETFCVTCFSDTISPDDTTNTIKSLVDEWKNISGLTDKEVLCQVRESNIDILVDLAGHTAANRLGVFAMQAAPIQATYLGYPNTTGLNTVKHRITDNLTDPVGDSDRLHTEKLIRLPDCFICYTPNEDSPDCLSPPFKDNNYISFGSFNVLAKISDECIRTWCSILHRVQGSKLILKSAGLEDPVTRAYIINRFRQYDVDPNHIEMIPRTKDIRSHLQLYNRVDITLDTFPYNGTTTTCESLHMGVPVISLRGNRHAGRVGYSILSQVKLEELVADNQDQYISIANNLAENTAQLHLYHMTLRSRLASSPLCDGQVFTCSLEKAFMETI